MKELFRSIMLINIISSAFVYGAHTKDTEDSDTWFTRVGNYVQYTAVNWFGEKRSKLKLKLTKPLTQADLDSSFNDLLTITEEDQKGNDYSLRIAQTIDYAEQNNLSISVEQLERAKAIVVRGGEIGQVLQSAINKDIRFKKQSLLRISGDEAIEDIPPLLDPDEKE